MPDVIALKELSKTYQRGSQSVVVLDDLSLEIKSGEFVALMGPSGSGKSTLLNLVAGLDKPTKGEVCVNGDRIDRFSRSQLSAWRARNVGFIFQFYNLLPALTAQDNVELPLLLTQLGSAERKRRVKTVLELVGLSDRANHKPSELSGGQQQRVAIARALVSDPTFLVCDEPTGDLDRETAEEVLTLIKTLNGSQRKTVLMVTHDPRAAEFAGRRIDLDKGRLRELHS